jgi:phage-related protein
MVVDAEFKEIRWQGDSRKVAHQKAKKGIATPKEEIDVASKRYKELVRSLRRS